MTDRLPIPYDVLSIPLPGGPGSLRAAPLASTWSIDWGGLPLNASFMAPGNDVSLLLERDGPASIDIPRDLAGADRTWRELLYRDPRSMIYLQTLHLLGHLARGVSGESDVDVSRVGGGWVGVGVRSGFGTTVISYMPRGRRWLLQLSGPSDWAARHRETLLRPRFRPPARLLLLPFAHECQRLLRASDALVSAELAVRGPDLQEIDLATARKLDPYDLYWNLELVPDSPERQLGIELYCCTPLARLYHEYLNEGRHPEEIVRGALARAKEGVLGKRHVMN